MNLLNLANAAENNSLTIAIIIIAIGVIWTSMMNINVKKPIEKISKITSKFRSKNDKNE